MDSEVKGAVLRALSDVQRNLKDTFGRALGPLIAEAAIGALNAWKAAGEAAEQYYKKLAAEGSKGKDVDGQ